MTTVASHLLRFRRRKLLNDFRSLGWILLTVVSMGILFFLSLEAIFWFPPFVRYTVWRTGLLGLVIFTAAVGTVLFLVRRDKVSRYSLSTLAAEVGEGEFTSSVRSRGEDEVINALQLETASGPHYGTSRQLAEQFIKKVALKLGLLAPADVLTGRQVTRFRRAAVAALAVSAVFWIAFFPFFQESAKHWIHPRTNFPVSHPFELVSLTGDLSLMGGDSTTIEFDVKGDSPGTISLEILEGDKSSLVQLDPGADGRFVHELPHVFQNLHYRAFVRSRHFWEPWGEISSPTYTISVIDRPAIREFVITITPPGYTGMSPMSQKENVAEIRALKGSSIGVHLTSDKILSRAYLRYVTAESPDRPSRIAMNVSQKGATGEILLTDDSAFETHIFDERDVGNLDPIQYRILMVEDVLPELQVLEPESPTELGSDFAIPVRLHIEDDFGFSNVQIVYETRHPAYLSGGVSSPPATTSESFGESHETVNVRGINTFSPEETSQDVFYIWDVGKLGLMPEDEIRFHFEVYDNDVVSGPKKSISPTLVARFPSLADLYARTEKEEQAVQDVAGEIVDDLQELDKALQSVELEVLKTEELSWEHEQTLKQSSADLQKKLEEIEGVRRKLQNIVEQSERHRLFSPDLLQKFKNLQDLLQDIITPELMESLDKLTESLGEVPAEDLLRALQNFRSNTAEIEHQLDRFIDIFQRIRAERRMDELVTRTEQLVSQQESLVTKLRVNSTETSGPRLTEEQQRNAQEFENIHDLMEDASKDMKSFARMPADDLRELARSGLSDETSGDLRSASRELRNLNYTGGLQRAISAHQNLQKVAARLESIQQAFRRETVQEMMAKFEVVLKNTLFISKEQENLQKETGDLPRNSPRLGVTATRQQLLRDQLGQLTRELIDLSRKTFAVSPEMGKAIGRATFGMNESLEKLEERNGRASAEKQGEAVAALNEGALATLAAMNDMEQSGMASGMEQFLERMQRMVAMQQGINDQTLQIALGQMEAMAQEGLMRRLAYEQEQLRRSVEQLINEMRGTRQGGESLKAIEKEMEKVVSDFRRGTVDRRTVERQQRILSRMLDSQRSLRQRDFSEKRRSTVAQQISRKGPSGLPSDLGQRRNLAMEALNQALKAGYSRDYQDMVRRYFNLLIQSSEISVQDEFDRP